MRILLLDDVPFGETPEAEIHRLPTDVPPEDLWTGGLPFAERSFDVIALSSRREPRDLYRVLALAERFIAPSGSIWLDGENIAIVTFLGVHEGWLRVNENSVIKLMRCAIAPSTLFRAEKITVSPRPIKVISVAAFGDPRYWAYLPGLVRAHHALFPGYTLRIHHDDGIYTDPYGPALLRLQRAGVVQLRHIPAEDVAKGKCLAMLHRLAPAWDEDVDYVFCRDLDSLPTWVDRKACEEFVRSDLDAHTIHAQPVHIGLMGGLSGFRAEALRSLYPSFGSLIEDAKDRDWKKHGADQDVLNDLLGHLPTLVHSLFDTEDEGGDRHRRSYVDEKVLRIHGVVYEPALLDDPRVPAVVRKAKLTNYPGAADYNLEQAITFFDEHGPKNVIAAIREAEDGI